MMDTDAPKQETGVRSLVLENEQQGSICTIHDLREWLQARVSGLLPHYDMITVPKGLIHESFFTKRIGIQSMEAIISRVLNAQFHIHEKVCLVNAGTTRTPTIVAKQNAIAKATLDSLLAREMEGVIAGSLPYEDEKGWSLRKVADLLESGLDQMDNGKIASGLNGFRALMVQHSPQYSTISGMRVSPWQEEYAYKLVRSIQSRTQGAMNIEWADMQIGIIPNNIWHGRSVLANDERSTDERLSAIEGSW